MMEQNQNWERPASETSIHSNNSDRHKSCDYSHHLKSLTKDSKEQQDENKQNGQVLKIAKRPELGKNLPFLDEIQFTSSDL
jgi:hypothetical protein